MKKITLFTATALTIMGLSGQSLVAQAAPNVIISYGSGCNIQSAFDQLQNCLSDLYLPENCLPNLNLPGNCFPSIQLPGTDCPGADAPEVDVPDVEAPEVNVPENNTPDNNGSDNNGTEDTTPEESPEEDSPNDSVHAYVKEVIDLVNAERAKEGLPALTMNKQVQAAAQVRAMECEQLFSHTRPNGTSFVTALQEQNVSYRRAGENIAWGQRTPQQVVTGWMNSAGHRANIMNPNFTTIGVGYYQNANGTNYWSQLFTS